MKSRNHTTMFKVIISVLCWVLIWALFSHSTIVSQSLLPPPEKVLLRMVEIGFIHSHIVTGMFETFSWVVFSWIIGLLVSLFIGALSIKCRWVNYFLSILFIGGRALPSVIAVPLFAAIMGIERASAAACSIFLVMCYSESSFRESLNAISKSRKAIKSALALSLKHEFIFIVLPGAARTWRAIAVQSFGIALVVMVAGEMILSFSNSVGDDVAQMMWLLKMVDLYAIVGWLVIWAIVINCITSALPSVMEWPGQRILAQLGKNKHSTMEANVHVK